MTKMNMTNPWFSIEIKAEAGMEDTVGGTTGSTATTEGRSKGEQEKDDDGHWLPAGVRSIRRSNATLAVR